MLTLPSVTLLGMDCVRPIQTIKAMQYSMLQVQFAKAVLVTSQTVFKPEMLRTIGGQSRLNIEPHFVEQGGRDDYERDIICDLHKHFDTSHCLFQEWDAAVINPWAWSDEWLQFDYIGAPWPWNFHERGFPPCTEANSVGNGGFSLRSRELCKKTAELWDFASHGWRCSDAWICRTMGDALKKAGVRFAPYDVGAMFCAENRFLNGQHFGIHGKNTIAMNGLKWDFSWLI